MLFKISGEEENGDNHFSARWADVTAENADKITDYAEKLLGAPDTVT